MKNETFSQCTAPVLTYEAQQWSLTKQMLHKLYATQITTKLCLRTPNKLINQTEIVYYKENSSLAVYSNPPSFPVLGVPRLLESISRFNGILQMTFAFRRRRNQTTIRTYKGKCEVEVETVSPLDLCVSLPLAPVFPVQVCPCRTLPPQSPPVWF